MGLPMARHLVAAGHDVVACDLEPERAKLLETAIGASPAEAATGADVAILSLPSPAAVEEAALGAGGLIEALAPGAVAVDMSTSPPSLARRLGAALGERGIQFLDAPVSGGPTGAEAGSLAIMVGGPADAFERCSPLFELMGGIVSHVGGHGAGQTVKLCNNLMAACAMAALSEACAVLVHEGLDPNDAYEVFTRATGDSAVLRRRFPIPGVRPEHPATSEYRPMFRLDLLRKDLALALSFAEEEGIALPMTDAAAAVYDEAMEAGLGGLDYSAVYLTRRKV
jgi:3-hydroxyisobutyrate dehydrogenase-like beta-hydroxyacid dehydrogenase